MLRVETARRERVKPSGPAHEPPLWDLVGHTPLVPLRLSVDGHAPTVYLKAEWFNPGGSVKDRPAREILRAGLALGALPGRRLLDASSGNTAIAYAMLGAAAAIGVTVCVPANVTTERLALLEAYGADVIETDPLEGTDGAIIRARQLADRWPERFWYADQYGNSANVAAHRRTTGPEIWRQTETRITHLIAGVGTSGTLMGVGQFLKEQEPTVRVIGVQPDAPFHGLEGLKHMATAIVPPIFDPNAADEMIAVTTEAADDAVRWLARERGIFVGWSTGAAVVAARQVIRGLSDADRRDMVMVVVAPDSGQRYLSERDRLMEMR